MTGITPVKIAKAAHEAVLMLGVDKDIDPFITLSFMALPVIPEIRCTPRGVYDVSEGKLLPGTAAK